MKPNDHNAHCPACGERLSLEGYSTAARDWRWWCRLCQVTWWQSRLRELAISQVRAAVIDELDAGGTD